MSSGLSRYTTGVRQVSTGAKQLSSQSQSLATGATSLQIGLTNLNEKVPTLTNGVSQLATGSQILTTGAEQISSGANQLAAGSSKVSDGLTTLQNGSSTLATQLTGSGARVTKAGAASKDKIEMFASPVSLSKTEYSSVDNYGSGLAPYFLSVSMFVGALAFNVTYSMSRVNKKLEKYRSIWHSKMTAWILLFSIIQAVILVTIMEFAMGIQTTNLFGLYMVAILSSLASMSIVTVLNVAFGTIGRGLSMILLVLQLGSAGGTFPIETSNNFFQFLNPLFPITYIVRGLRHAISGGVGNETMWEAVAVLLAYSIVFSLLLGYVFKRKFKKGTLEVFDEELI